MNSKFLRICSMILTIVMLFNMLPAQALGEMIFTEKQSVSATDETLFADTTVTNSTDSAEIVEEIEENRTEYTKEFKLSNGLHMAVVYGDPVHYDNNGKWDEIDNTLKATTKGTYTNTAGVWDVSLPQQLNGSNPVTITKDGYTLSFVLAGELNKPSDAVVMSEKSELTVQDVTSESGELTAHSNISIEAEDAAEPYAIASAQSASAQVVDLDYESYKAEAEHEETVIEKRQSRLLYANVYSATNITYDLSSNQVKESIIMRSYREALRGYKYTLNVGTLVPVLGEDGHIDFYNEDKTEIIMVMPAPFLMDSANEYNPDVQVQLTGSGSTYTLSYILPQTWLADEARQWPVVLDPVVQTESTVSNIIDQNVYSLGYADPGAGVLQCGYSSSVGRCRAFLRYDHLPELSPADVIVDAKIRLYKANNNTYAKCVEVHKVLEEWDEGEFQWADQPAFDDKVEDYNICRTKGECYWNVTDIAREWFEGNNTGMLFKLSYAVENAYSPSYAQFWSADYSYFQIEEKPTLLVYFRNNNGLEGYWDYTSASAGRAGTGYVNDYTGNLVWTRNDIEFGGNRAPVSISHVYNANDTVVRESSNNSMATSGNAFGMGYGWRTNFNQLIYQWSTNSNYYVWEDEDGTDHYFAYDADKQAIVDEDGLELTLAVTEDGYTITHKYGAVDYFDSHGRLYKQENNQATKSAIQVYYTTDSGKLIDYITDGVGRKYDFTYNENGMLTRISYLGSEEYQEAHANQADREISYVTYAYDANNNLISVTDKDGKTSSYSYILNGHLLTSAQDIDGYTLTYTYTKTEAGKPSRIATINESHNNVQGSSLTLTYAHNQTTFTDHNGNKQISQFNDYGNTVSMQDGLGRAQHAKFTFNTPSDAAAAKEAGTTSAKSNQLAVASKMQNTVKNYLTDPSFENGTAWDGGSISTAQKYIGEKSMFVASDAYIHLFNISSGESVTFSAYVKTTDGSAMLCLSDNSGDHFSPSIEANTDWTRLEINYTNESDEAQQISVELMVDGDNGAYIDCVQVEKMPTASRYNLIDNGDFSNSLTRWTGSNYTLTTGTSGAPQLDNNMVTVTGDPSATRQLTQIVQVSGKQGDTFVLAGWAKGDSVPLSDTRTFGIIGTFNYTDGTTGDFTASFNPDTYPTDEENAVVWQYTAAPMVAKQDYSSITVKLSYDYNANTVYFDGIQLFKETFGQSYDYDDDGNIKSIVDLQNAKTTYEYTGNDLTKEILPTGAEMTYTYDAYHNVLSATTAENLVYNFVYDTYGNNTSVSISSEAGTKITSSAHYSEDGNRLEYTTDALDKDTLYDYDAETNVLKSVQFPEDTAATKTTYTYDEMYRNARIAATTNTGLAMSAEYTYTDDVMTRIKTPTTTYNFEYGNFGLRKGVYILDAESTDDPQYLAEYTYTNRNNYLDTIDYGNGDKVQYEYDSYGRLLTETYEDNDVVSYQYDNDGGLAAVTDSETEITTRYYYDFSGRATGYSEKSADFSHTVGYEYDISNNMTSYVETIDGQKRTSSYTYNDDNRITSVTVNGITVEYVYDSFDRLTQKTTKNGDTVVLTEYYTFKEVDNTTSNQVWKYRTKSDKVDITYEYAYDDNGNIISIYDGSLWKYYTYDSANQLIREDNQERGRTYTWTYDSAGNILSYKTYYYNPTQTDETKLTSVDTAAYSYSEGEWKDLLISFDGNAITYDGMGNPLTYGTTEFTWEHGRQLASMTKNGVEWTYTYSNTGLRTSRSNGTTTYKYVYDGSVLKQMTIINETDHTEKIVGFTYDATGSPLTMTYDGATYYYITNMQGDVVGLLDSAGNRMISYQYTAYGRGYIISGESSMTSILSTVNPIGYRGYVMDVGTATYYCQSRYYDPAIGRFLNADAYPATGQGLTGNNMFAYCGNNPVSRMDSVGLFWDTVFDVVSLVVSVVEVVSNPTSVSAWAGLAGDVIDVVVPCIGGVGEVIKATSKAKKAAEIIDGSHDTAKVVKNSVEASKKLHRPYIRKSTRQAVEKSAKRLPDGRFLDANTGMPINGKYDLGHKYGHEFWRERDNAMAKGWTQKQFNDYMNNPSFYRIEDPRLNRSHKYEMR